MWEDWVFREEPRRTGGGYTPLGPSRHRRMRGYGARSAGATTHVLVVFFLVALFVDGLSELGGVLPFAPSKLIGYLLAGLVCATRLRGVGWLKPPAVYFVVYLFVGAAIEAARQSQFMQAGGIDIPRFWLYLQYAQAVILYLLLEELFRDTRLVHRVVVVFLLCVVGMAVLSMVRAQASWSGSAGARMGLEWLNLNEQGFLYALALIGLATLGLERSPRHLLAQVGLITVVGLMLVAMFRTGSRSAVIALVVGLVVTTALNVRRRRLGAYVLVVLTLTLASAAAFVAGGGLMKSRFEAVVDARSGQSGMRMELAESGLELLWRSPVFGRGVAHTDELGGLVFGMRGGRIGVHNTYLQLLLSFGIVGTIPWVIGVVAVVRRAWRVRSHPWGATMVSLLVATLVFSIGGLLGYNKQFWILLALASQAHLVVRERPRILQKGTIGGPPSRRCELPELLEERVVRGVSPDRPATARTRQCRSPEGDR